MATSEDAAVAAAAALLAAAETETEETEAETEETEEDDFLNFTLNLTEDLEAELAEEAETEEEEEDEFEDDDETNPELLKRLKKAEREARHYRELRSKDSAKLWREEAKKVFPYSEPFLADMKADSRRDFLRRAKELHLKVEPLMQKARDVVTAEKAKAKDEARKEAEKVWGRPPGSATVPSDASATRETVERAREKKDLVGAIKAMAFGSKEE